MTNASGARCSWFRNPRHALSLSLLVCAGACHKDIAVESISVAVLPETAFVDAGATQQFTAEVNGLASTAVTWSVMSGGAGGTISASGLYSAPGAARNGSDTVIATSTADPSASASAHVSVVSTVPVEVDLTPANPIVLTGQTVTFTASLSDGSAFPSVAWSVMPGGAGGAIDASGVYTAPAHPGTDTIVALVTLASGSTAQGATVARVQLAPPADLVYAPDPLLCTIGQPCSSAPSQTGGAVATYAVTPALPAGLSLDPAAGTIAGTPTALAPLATFTVTATNAGGSATAMPGVEVVDLPPAGLAYSPMELVCTINLPCSLAAPTQTGGQVVSFAIDPALPAGLRFSDVTGEIAGTATALLARTPFTVTATNSGGSAAATLYVTVKDQPPKTLVYDPSALLCYVGVECSLAAPTYTGGAVTSFTASPALPAGLFLNADGSIVGIATIASAAAMVTVTASNSGGSATAQISVEVLPPLATNAINGALAAGANHTCALAGSGAFCWGANYSGQLGNASVDPDAGSLFPVPVDGLSSGVQAIAAGFDFTCAIVNGDVECWGSNEFGKLGNNSTGDSTEPVAVGLAGAQMITAGENHACALADGALYCWGSNNQGQLGDGDEADSAVPVAVQNLTADAVQAIAAGALHTCAVVNGGVQCWGANGSGQLGVSTNIETSSTVPVQVAGLSSGARALAVGELHSCALVDGAMKCWGYDADGELGNNQTTNSTSAIVVNGLSEGVQAIAAGGFHSCAVVDGAVQCWGFNESGQLGNNNTCDNPDESGCQSLIPVASGLTSSVQSLALGLYHSCALVNGGVHCWGNNFDGELGNNSEDDSHVPVATWQLIDGLQAVATGGDFTCALVDGALQCWGGNESGQLGNNSTQSSLTSVAVAGLTGVDQVRAGQAHACAIASGAIYCWGDDANGELGDGAFGAGSSVPVQVLSVSSGAQDLSLGAAHACAVVDGAALCWGANASGQLGNNSTADSAIPVAVQGLTSGVLAVAAGGAHTCALMTDESVNCWGDNSQGQLGSAGAGALVPVPVAMLPPIQSLAAGNQFNCASGAGGLLCWGANQHGQLGDNSTASSAAPQQPAGLDHGVRAIAAGDAFACALVDSGLLCWGADGAGQLGNGALDVDSSVPVALPALSQGVLGFASGPSANHTCALVSGALQCWGTDNQGELGDDGAAPSENAPVTVSILQHLPAQ